jgi:transcriptional regulator with XRE-family HTH domain
MSIGKKIKQLRELRNFTQTYMAERLILSLGGYSKIERDETELTLARIKQIAAIFEMDYIKLITFDKSLVFNITNNHNGYGGLVHNHQNNSDPGLQNLIAQIVSDNQEFKAVLVELLKTRQ